MASVFPTQVITGKSPLEKELNRVQVLFSGTKTHSCLSWRTAGDRLKGKCWIKGVWRKDEGWEDKQQRKLNIFWRETAATSRTHTYKHTHLHHLSNQQSQDVFTIAQNYMFTSQQQHSWDILLHLGIFAFLYHSISLTSFNLLHDVSRSSLSLKEKKKGGDLFNLEMLKGDTKFCLTQAARKRAGGWSGQRRRKRNDFEIGWKKNCNHTFEMTTLLFFFDNCAGKRNPVKQESEHGIVGTGCCYHLKGEREKKTEVIDNSSSDFNSFKQRGGTNSTLRPPLLSWKLMGHSAEPIMENWNKVCKLKYHCQLSNVWNTNGKFHRKAISQLNSEGPGVWGGTPCWWS